MIRRIFRLLIVAAVAVVSLMSCKSRPHDVAVVDVLPAIYPDYVGVTVPLGIAPLNFCMSGNDYQTMDVVVKGAKSGELHVNGDYADFDVDDWH